MDLSLDCHQILVTKIPTVAPSECSCHVRFSVSSSMISGARMFCMGVLTLVILTLSNRCDYVEGLSFAFNGFAGLSDVYSVRQAIEVWTYNTDNYSLTMTPDSPITTTNIAGRFLFPTPVQMMEPGTTTAKNFSTTFIFQIFLQPASASMLGGVGPGLAFIIVPDNVTVGDNQDYMGILTTTTSSTTENYASDNHTFAVELDTHMNPEFNDPNNNHICIDVASLNSTENNTFEPTIPLTTASVDRVQQVWIDYIEADSRINIYHGEYPLSKPATPLGYQVGVDLSILKEYMYLGFSSSVGLESSNLHSILAWSFSNEGEAPPIKIGRDSNQPPGLAPSPTPGAPSPSGQANAPSSSGQVNAPPPSSLSTPSPSSSNSSAASMEAAIAAVFFIVGGVALCCYCKYCRPRRSSPITFEFGEIIGKLGGKKLKVAVPSTFPQPLPVHDGPKLHIFISHTSGENGTEKNFPKYLEEYLKENQRYKVFIDCRMRRGIDFPTEIIQEIPKTDLAIVVVTKDYFGRRWPMLELVEFVELHYKDTQAPKVRVLPLFYMLKPKEVKDLLDEGYWEDAWAKMSTEGRHPIDVKRYRETVRTLCNLSGIEYNYRNRSHELEYIKLILEEVNKIHIDMQKQHQRLGSVQA